MDLPALISSIAEAVPGARIEPFDAADGEPTVYVAAGDLPRVLQALRDLPALRFALLAELTAADYFPRDPRFELIYQLVSLEHRLRLRVKVRLAGADAHVATATGIWPGANWLEREVWDLFGIAFDGHPDPRRLLMPEDWEGYPLRKDYPVQIVRRPRIDEAMQVTEEEFRANLQRDRLSRPSPGGPS
jgi:NADH-quinone oxidoreductase subunit C